MKRKTFLPILFCLSFCAQTFAGACKLPDPSELVNTGATLAQIAQESATSGQCDLYRHEKRRIDAGKGPSIDRDVYLRAMVLCGKEMFLGFSPVTKVGIPVKILELIEGFPGVGPKLEGLGLLKDETWDKRWPFGVGYAQNPSLSFKNLKTKDVVQLSCASCHTAKLPDGRYSLGAANENFDYSGFNIFTLFSVWAADKRKYDETRWDSELIEKYQGLLEISDNDFIRELEAVASYPLNDFIIKYLIGEEPPPIATQKGFLTTKKGLYNGFAPSINFIDKNLVTAAPNLWGISEEEAHFGSLAGHSSMDDFIGEAYVYTTRSKKYVSSEYIEPMREFLNCLEAPKNSIKKSKRLARQGRAIFKRSCSECHDLKNGGGSQAVQAQEVNFPDEYLQVFKGYAGPDIQSQRTLSVLRKLNLDKVASSAKVKRLTGIWSKKFLTTNGQVEGLDHLFCLNGKSRVADKSSALDQSIHSDLCEDYSKEDKQALKEHLLSL